MDIHSCAKHGADLEHGLLQALMSTLPSRCDEKKNTLDIELTALKHEMMRGRQLNH
jgi:hypothetical protein